MTVALDLYLSTFFGELGVVLAVGVLVYVCAKACEWVAHEWKLRRVWRDEPFTRATPGVVSRKPVLFDQETAREV